MFSTSNDLPNNEEIFKIIMLKSQLIWHSLITKEDIEKWLSNFSGKVFDIDYEHRIALWMLANFVYYNQNEVRHFCKTIFREYIHQILIKLHSEESSVKNLEREMHSLLNASRFCCLGKPGESCHYILYYFRQV